MQPHTLSPFAPSLPGNPSIPFSPSTPSFPSIPGIPPSPFSPSFPLLPRFPRGPSLPGDPVAPVAPCRIYFVCLHKKFYKLFLLITFWFKIVIIYFFNDVNLYYYRTWIRWKYFVFKYELTFGPTGPGTVELRPSKPSGPTEPFSP